MLRLSISPQGVTEEYLISAVHKEEWMSFKSSGEEVQFRQSTFMQWNSESKLFEAEIIYLDSNEFLFIEKKKDFEKKLVKQMTELK